MKAKEFLKQYEYASKRVRMLENEYRTELLNIDAIGSTLAGDGLPHGNGVSRKTEDKAVKLSDTMREWEQAIKDAKKIREKVFRVVVDVPGIEGEVLYNRYILLQTWEQVADDLHYSYTGIHKCHKRALGIVDQMLNESV